MSQYSEETQQKIVASCVGGGLVMVVLGPLVIVMGRLPVVMVGGFLMIGAGIIAIAFGIVVGFMANAATKAGSEKREANCRIMARYGVDSQGDIVTADFAEMSDDVRTYIRLYSPTKGALEYECAYPVWCQCGEGMLGTAVTQGRWLSSFIPQNAPVQP